MGREFRRARVETSARLRLLIKNIEKVNKNLIIGVLVIIAIVFGFLWYNQSQELAEVKFGDTPISVEQTKNDDKEMDAAFKQIDEDIRMVDIWQKLQCTPKTRLDCDGTNCTQSQPVVYLILDRQNKTFSRCDTKGCDAYDAIFGSSGIYTNIQPRNPSGMMIKVLGNREYIEMATIGLSTVFQNGSCSEIR
ncbi:MAG: hypothetical protein HYT27_03405 [Parcubacteria group bacterium]|nr:hypothetical protein [Parcubacteria group bacterium]